MRDSIAVVSVPAKKKVINCCRISSKVDYAPSAFVFRFR